MDRQQQSKKPFLFALLYTLCIFYFMQTSCYYYWTTMMFPTCFAGHINDIYFAYTNFLEFFFFIFIRTRTSIKFAPKFITIINVMFLLYINSYMYGAQLKFFAMIFMLTIGICFAFLEFFEVPAIRDWNPFDVNTPRYACPRIGFQRVFSDSTFGTSFDIWQIFMPLRGRQRFTMYEQGAFDQLSEYPGFGVDYNPRRRQA